MLQYQLKCSATLLTSYAKIEQNETMVQLLVTSTSKELPKKYVSKLIVLFYQYFKSALISEFLSFLLDKVLHQLRSPYLVLSVLVLFGGHEKGSFTFPCLF